MRMTAISLVLTAFSALVIVAAPAQAQDPLVANGGFESPAVVGAPYATRTADQLDGGAVGGENVDQVHAISLQPASGDHTLDLNSEGPGRVWQDIATEAAQRYELRFM